MTIRYATMGILLACSLASAQPGMGAGKGMGGGPGRGGAMERPQERTEKGFHGQEVWMNAKLHEELGLTDMQKQKMRAFVEDTSTGLQSMHVQKVALEDALVEALNRVPMATGKVEKIQSDLLEFDAKFLKARIAASKHFFALLSPEQHKRFADLHERMKYDRAKRSPSPQSN